jgi:ribonuclease HI
MPKTRKRQPPRILHQSPGPLPDRFGERFAGQLLVFCDASRKRHGGLAAVLFANPEQPPLSFSRRVTVTGSNELELRAALFALQQAALHFPGRRLALFTDNSDAASRLATACEHGAHADPGLLALVPVHELAALLAAASVHWLKGHGTCRGNTLADELAGAAAA